MKYDNFKQAIFLSRPNRFIAEAEVDGKIEICHVKNTGRCREILKKGAVVYLCESNSDKRKTRYDLVSVYKKDELINIDSMAPNVIFKEWAIKNEFFGKDAVFKAETKYGNSRFDYFITSDERRIFVEVKGVTLENDGIAAFPDAPTMRGVKHLNELCSALGDGFEAYVFFVIQMKNIKWFEPNRQTHPEFADALLNAAKSGVKVFAIDCIVNPGEVRGDCFVDVKLD